MILLPAIDVFEGRAVRLYKGDYNKMTVYHDNPVDQALRFKNAGRSTSTSSTWRARGRDDAEFRRHCGHRAGNRAAYRGRRRHPLP